MMQIKTFLLAAIFTLFAPQLMAEELLMVRSAQAFPETMLALQYAITKQGYKVSRVQRVDIGLTKSGFKTDKYRIVFFGKHDEISDMIEKYPEITPYLPLKIAIFAEETQTLMVSMNPLELAEFFPQVKANPVIERWARDLNEILEEIRIQE